MPEAGIRAQTDGHIFERDTSLSEWHSWHSFRRGLATNLHALGVDRKTIQAILRHSNVGDEHLQVAAMDTLGKKIRICNDPATNDGDDEEQKPQTRVLQ